MCFTQKITGAMMTLCLGTGLFLTAKQRPWKQTQVSNNDLWQ